MHSIHALIARMEKHFPGELAKALPVDAEQVAFFEHTLGHALPNDYKQMLQVTDGFSLLGNEVCGLAGAHGLAALYHREHALVAMPQYAQLVPFSPDGRGNFYCFDTASSTHGGQSCTVLFWASNYPYNAEDTPEITHQSFGEWLEECMIEWNPE